MRTKTEDPVSSGEARAAILSCHDELRGLLTETIHRAEGAADSATDFEPLRAQARELVEAFEEHTGFEARILPAALRDVIGWGDVLQAELVEGHARQRAVLASARSALGPEGLSPVRLVQSVRSLANRMLDDLKAEERCLLNADLDALTTDGHGG